LQLARLQQRVQEPTALADRVQPRVHRAADPGFERVARPQRVADSRLQQAHLPVQHRQQELAPVGEVGVAESLADACGRGDRFHRDGIDTLFGHQHSSNVKKVLASLLAREPGRPGADPRSGVGLRQGA